MIKKMSRNLKVTNKVFVDDEDDDYNNNDNNDDEKEEEEGGRWMCEKRHRQEILTQTPVKYHSSLCPLNLEEEKRRFLSTGLLPRFQLKQSNESVEQMISSKRKFQIRFDLFNEASRILETVKKKFGDGAAYLRSAYGDPILCPAASEMVYDYLRENAIDDNLQVLWSSDISCSGRMTWHGPAVKRNKPEERKYTLWLKNSTENAFLREKGITCLADHEIGTHYFRMCNDGLQPWFSRRDKFGLKGLRSFQLLRTEEGLATLNTVLNARVKYLWYPALLYFSACMASEMTFKELFDHLELYIRDDEQRWKHVMRIKRGLQNPNDYGGCGKDQCYFEGAVDILRNMESIDFHLLMSGKICLEDLPRVRRMARQNCIKFPTFMKDMTKYKRLLKQIAQINGIPTEAEKREKNFVPSTNFDVFLHKVKTSSLTNKFNSRKFANASLDDAASVGVTSGDSTTPPSVSIGASDAASKLSSPSTPSPGSLSSIPSRLPPRRRISGRRVVSTGHAHIDAALAPPMAPSSGRQVAQRRADAATSPTKSKRGQTDLERAKNSLITDLYSARSARRVAGMLGRGPVGENEREREGESGEGRGIRRFASHEQIGRALSSEKSTLRHVTSSYDAAATSGGKKRNDVTGANKRRSDSLRDVRDVDERAPG